MRFLLDTNVISALMTGNAAVAARVARTHPADVGISQVTVAEIEFGLRKVPTSKRGRELQARWLEVGSALLRVPWDDEVSQVFGETKARLDRVGQRLSDFDIAIASHAIAHGLVLVTDDAAFDRLDLRRENWLR